MYVYVYVDARPTDLARARVPVRFSVIFVVFILSLYKKVHIRRDDNLSDNESSRSSLKYVRLSLSLSSLILIFI